MPPKSIQIIQAMLPDIFVESGLAPSQFIQKYWTIYEDNFQTYDNVSRYVFEELIAITLMRKKILPFYMHATVTSIPTVKYDFVVYCKGVGVFVLSARPSPTYTWKQADLEAVALKYSHPKSELFVISTDEHEVATRKANLDDVMAINDFILATTPEYDALLTRLQQMTTIESPNTSIVSSNVVITEDNFNERWG